MHTVYRCPITGDLYPPGDPELTGLGNPPRSPNAPVGAGRIQMSYELISNKDYKELVKKRAEQEQKDEEE